MSPTLTSKILTYCILHFGVSALSIIDLPSEKFLLGKAGKNHGNPVIYIQELVCL